MFVNNAWMLKVDKVSAKYVLRTKLQTNKLPLHQLHLQRVLYTPRKKVYYLLIASSLLFQQLSIRLNPSWGADQNAA